MNRLSFFKSIAGSVFGGIGLWLAGSSEPVLKRGIPRIVISNYPPMYYVPYLKDEEAAQVALSPRHDDIWFWKSGYGEIHRVYYFTKDHWEESKFS